MIGQGLFAVHGTGTPLHFAVDVKPEHVGLVVFERVAEGVTEGMAGTATWAELEKYLAVLPTYGNKAGFVDYQFNEVLITDLPGTEHGGIYKGRSYIFADGMNGLDEIVDYSLIDITTGNQGLPQPWRNRFAQSAKEKIDFSFRFRALNQVANALVIFMPFDGPFTEARVEVLCDIDPILLNGTVLTGRIDDAIIPKDGIWFKQWYFSAVALEQDLEVAAGGSITVPFKLIWNKDGSDCLKQTRFKVESDAGYLPKQRVFTDSSGKASVSVHALGLEPGDKIKVKLNAEHYSGVGVMNIKVV